MRPDRKLVLGCATPVKGRPTFLRTCVLQVQAQTLRPDFHALFLNGTPDYDQRFIDDLLDDRTLVAHDPATLSSLMAATGAMKMLLARDVDLYFLIDSDDLYRATYLETIYQYLCDSPLHLTEDFFCLNLVKQQWVNLYEDATATLEERSFERGFGLSDEEQRAGMVVGAPPTFVMNRRTVEMLIAQAEVDPSNHFNYRDIFWRRSLLAAGVKITQVSTAQPIFAYVRHKNNSTRKGTPPTLAKPPLAPPSRPNRIMPSGEIDVSVVIPTYNEGEWLRRTIESILAAKTDLRYEVVVVDDGCDDGSVAAISDMPNVRVCPTGSKQSGLIIGKNLGACQSLGECLCFLDSHVLVRDGWLNYLYETSRRYGGDALVTGNLLNITELEKAKPNPKKQYAYTLKDGTLQGTWHYHGCDRPDTPYAAPLCPGGLMFVRRSRFDQLGGFAKELRKWGREDLELSLKNYYTGGGCIVDPRVVVYHFYKDLKQHKPTFTVDYRNSYFNALQVALTYFPEGHARSVQAELESRGNIADILSEVQAARHAESRHRIQQRFVRGFTEWTTDFSAELRKFFDAHKSPD